MYRNYCNLKQICYVSSTHLYIGSKINQNKILNNDIHNENLNEKSYV